MVVARFYRYGTIDQEEFDTVDEAVRFLAFGEDAGTLSSHEIADGDRLIRRPEVVDLVRAAWRDLR